MKTTNRKNTLRVAMSIISLAGAVLSASAQNQLTANLTVTNKEIIGTTGTAAGALHVVDTGTATPRGIIHDQYNAGTNSSQFNARKARGTFAAPTTIVSGDVIGRFIAWAHDGSNFIETGNLRFTSSGTIAATRVPSQLEVYTSTNATPSVLTLALTIDNAQLATFTAGIVMAGPLSGVTTFGASGVLTLTNATDATAGTAGTGAIISSGGASFAKSVNIGTTTPGNISGSSGALSIAAAGTNKAITLTPSGSGNVVIATASNQGIQFTTSAADNFISGLDNSTTFLRAGTANNGGFINVTGGSAGTPNVIRFGHGSTESARFAASGNLLIAGVTADGTGDLQGAGTITGKAGNMTIVSGTGNSRTMALQTTTSGGTATSFLVADATQGITAGSLAGTGSRAVIADANGLLSAPVSDETWKENLRALPDKMGLQTILALRPLVFNYKDKHRFGEQDYIGFGARATSAVLPEVTGRDRDGTFYLTDEKLTAPLVLAVQQQQRMIAAIDGGKADWWARGIASLALVLAMFANIRKK